MKEPTTLLEAIQYFSDPENCRKFMVFVRWPDGVVRCPRCGHDKVAYLEKSKLYFCPQKHPKQKFSLKVGTIFEDSPIGLDKWLPAAWLIANCKNGISSYELARAVGVTQKSGWHMLHRLREAMQKDPSFKMTGPCEVDETFLGGQDKNKHLPSNRRFIPDGNGGFMENPNYVRRQGHHIRKAVVLGMLDREMREVRAHVIPNVKREVLIDAILSNIDKNSTVYTDKHTGYSQLGMMEYVHESVNHVNEYVRGQVHTNGIENFWSLLKRGIKGTYVAVEPFHLDAYVAEQVFRFNNRATKDNPLTDADRFLLLVSQTVGKRLTYAELTGKEDVRSN